MSRSSLAKQAIVISSNVAIVALFAVGVAHHWSHHALSLFLNFKLGVALPCLVGYAAFMIVMPLVPKPKTLDAKSAAAATAAPSIFQARFMATSTAVIDYCVVGALLLFWNSVCRLDDGSLCPFTAACTYFLQFVIMPVKDEIQCRILWRRFISPLKLSSWPYNWKTSIDQILFITPYGFLSLLLFCLSGMISFETILKPQVLLRVWLEVLAAAVTADVFMILAHRWMHEKAYFIHKKHHESCTSLVSFLFPRIDLLDTLLEFGAGMPLLIVLKKFLGLDPRMHLLTYNIFTLWGFQIHSGNPYAVYFFNPFLDYLARPALFHGLHHAIQKGYYTFLPFSHFLSKENRHKDIELYNKHMKTGFPLSV